VFKEENSPFEFSQQSPPISANISMVGNLSFMETAGRLDVFCC